MIHLQLQRFADDAPDAAAPPGGTAPVRQDAEPAVAAPGGESAAPDEPPQTDPDAAQQPTDPFALLASRARRASYRRLVREARAAAEAYPAMDLKAELNDPAFRRLLRAGVDVRSAYELRHRGELMSGAMEHAVRTVAEKLAQSLPAATARPLENGAGSTGAAAAHPDVSRLTRAQRRALIERAKAGERIEL